VCVCAYMCMDVHEKERVCVRVCVHVYVRVCLYI